MYFWERSGGRIWSGEAVLRVGGKALTAWSLLFDVCAFTVAAEYFG